MHNVMSAPTATAITLPAMIKLNIDTAAISINTASANKIIRNANPIAINILLHKNAILNILNQSMVCQRQNNIFFIFFLKHQIHRQ